MMFTLILSIILSLQPQIVIFDFDEFIWAGLDFSHEINSAEIAEDIARNSEAAAFGNMLPRISFNFSYTKTDKPLGVGLSVPSLPVLSAVNPQEIIGFTPAIDTYLNLTKDDFKTASITLVQPLFWGGKIYKNYRIQNLVRQTASEYTDIAQQNTVFQCVVAFASYQRAKSLLASAQSYEQAIACHLRDVENLYKSGVVIENDLEKTRIYHQDALLSIQAAENALKLAQMNVCRLSGLDMSTEIIFSDSLPELSVPELDQNRLVEYGMNNRNELTVAELNLSVADERKDISFLRFVPDVTLFGTLRANNPDFELEDKWETGWVLGVDLSYTLFEGFGRIAQVSASSSSQAQARENIIVVCEMIELEIRNGVLDLELSKSKLSTTKEKYLSSLEYLELSKLRFTSGVITNSELLDAYLLLSEAETDLISAKADLVVSFAKLKASLGTLYPSDVFSEITEVNN
ncbi:TolC family protein [candidate division WOR-3 bacterium]|nr:TolC family protein [candidate division WOR-3 bacterium]